MAADKGSIAKPELDIAAFAGFLDDFALWLAERELDVYLEAATVVTGATLAKSGTAATATGRRRVAAILLSCVPRAQRGNVRPDAGQLDPDTIWGAIEGLCLGAVVGERGPDSHTTFAEMTLAMAGPDGDAVSPTSDAGINVPTRHRAVHSIGPVRGSVHDGIQDERLSSH